MTISGLTRTLATAAATATVLATASAPAQAGPARGGGTMVGAPVVGTCSTMSAPQAAAPVDRSTAVACKQPHTARVAGVVRLPAALDWDTVKNKQLFAAVASRCAPKVWKTLGRSAAARDTSAYGYVWFEPTKAEKQAGSRWLSCSIILRHGKRLADLPNNRNPMLPKGRHADGIARCLTKAVLTTQCSASHAWRATGTFALKAAERPAAKSLKKTAARKCLSRVDRHKRFFRYTYPGVYDWAAGDHTVVCFSQSRR